MAVWRGSLYRVNARGGAPRRWLSIDPGKEIDFHGLAALPDRRVVFAAHQKDNRFTVETFDGTKRSPLLPSIDPATINAFGTIGGFWYSIGHLLFTRFDANHGLWAIPFGPGALDIHQAFLVAPNAVNASVAADGTLMIMNESPNASFELSALNRAGQVERTIGAASSSVKHPAVSPDGGRIAVIRATGSQEDLWVDDLKGGASARLTFNSDAHEHPAWFPRGNRVLVSEHAQLISGAELTAFDIDASAKPQVLAKGHLGVVSPNGRELLFIVDEGGSMHLRSATLAGDGSAGPGRRVFTVDPEPDVRDFAVSPDGRLLAYVDYKAGQADLLLTKFPGAEGRWQVVANGGRALWATDGSLRWARGTGELFFALSNMADPSRAQIMSAEVVADRAITISRPVPLFEAAFDDVAPGFDIAPDGKSVFMRRRAAAPQPDTRARFVLVQNWLAEFAK